MKKILFTIFLPLLCSCARSEGSLDFFFEPLEAYSPRDVIKEFKNASLDSVIINNTKYNAIFLDAASSVFRNPNEKKRFENYIEQNDLAFAGTQAKWAIIAAFHKKLNGEQYDIHALRDQMTALSNKIEDEKYGKVRH